MANFKNVYYWPPLCLKGFQLYCKVRCTTGLLDIYLSKQPKYTAPATQPIGTGKYLIFEFAFVWICNINKIQNKEFFEENLIIFSI